MSFGWRDLWPRRSSSETSPPQRPAVLEIQYHPADIRRGVRYFFLTRKRFRTLALAGLFYGLFLLASLVLLPGTIANLYALTSFDRQVEERSAQGEQLKVLVARFAAIESEVKNVRFDLDKIRLAYGLPDTVSRGQGGFPEKPVDVAGPSIYVTNLRQGNSLQASAAEELGVLGSLLEEVQSFEAANRDQVRVTPSLSPLRGPEFVLTSPFGSRTSPFTRQPDFHAGIDLAARPGTEILAPAAGTVVFAGRYPLKESPGWWRYGNLVTLRHGDRFITLFGHCDEIRVRTGQQVKQGDVIATVGNTGWSTSPHLHYEVRKRIPGGGFEPYDPRVYILNHRWSDEELVLIRARHAPEGDFEPLPDMMVR